MADCNPGLRNVVHLCVADEHTAVSCRSGDVDVLGTPTVLALAEEACVAAIRGELPDGETSVGTWAEVHHDRPVGVGGHVDAIATLVGRHGRRLEFTVVVRHGDEVVARVRHNRQLLDRDRFMDRVTHEAAQPATQRVPTA